MKRSDFLSKSFRGAAGLVAFNALPKTSEKSTYYKLIENVGFNHLPNQKTETMNTVLHKAETRGIANHGWLQSRHTFSFANYRNPERMNFGVLRVLNDDIVAPGRGFGTHPHDNMEIISIPLQGDLEHKDSMGNVATIKQGDIQVMSAGTGVYHSEYNKNDDKEVQFLQIWMFPNQRNVTPRYDQLPINTTIHTNDWVQVLSPDKEDDGVWVHQNAWFSIGNFEKGYDRSYQIKKKGNGIYLFVLEGEVKVGEQVLRARDGYGVWDTDSVSLSASEDARVLLMDVPMELS